MISAFANTWKVAELRERIIFTLLMIVIVRLGVHIALPGVDTTSIAKMMDSNSTATGNDNGIVGAMVGMFSGGGLQQLGIFALGIMPYISASILTQLMTSIVAGTLLLMWIGDQMTDRGIGNGTSIIITVNIISAGPTAIALMWTTLIGGPNPTAGAIFILFLFLFLIFIVACIICITQAQRRVAIHYAKRVVGRKQYGGQTQYLPLKINYANVMPIIFATAVIGIPTFIVGQFNEDMGRSLSSWLSPEGIWYYVIAGTMIFFFAYFWVATMFNPSEISENLKKSGGYIPGVRPGPATAKFLDYTMTRLTFAGAVFLVIIFTLPYLVTNVPKWFMNMEPLDLTITMIFGGTSLLIMVGVILDVMRQIETHLLQRNYDGFLRKGKIKGRYDSKGARVKSNQGGSVIYLMALAAVLLVGGIAIMIVRNIGG